MKKTTCLFLIAFVLFFLVGCKSTAEITTQPTLLPTESRTPTPIPPTLTETPTPEPPTATSTLTATPEPTDTLTPSPTFTEEPVTLTTNVDIGCRFGPDIRFSIQQFISADTQLAVLGRIEDGLWWLVEGLDGDSCWVMNEVVSLQGPVANLVVLTPPVPPTDTPTPTQDWLGISYVVIAENAGGYFGCDDGLRLIYPGIKESGDLEKDILAALNALFSNHNQYYNGLYNPLYASNLRATDVDIKSADLIEIQLQGQLVRPKTECDSKRMHAQVWQTVAQYTDHHANIYVNNAKLGDLLELP